MRANKPPPAARSHWLLRLLRIVVIGVVVGALLLLLLVSFFFLGFSRTGDEYRRHQKTETATETTPAALAADSAQ